MAKGTKTLRMELDIFSALDSICERHGDMTYHIEKALRGYAPIKKAMQVKPAPAKKSAEVYQGEPVGKLQVSGGGFHLLYQADVDVWSQLYPGVDIMQELRSMYGWLDGNPTKVKTKGGIKKFINSWLARAQNNGPTSNDRQFSTGGGRKPTSTAARISAQAQQVFADAEAEEAAERAMGTNDSTVQG